MVSVATQLRTDAKSVNKYQIARHVLEALNARGDSGLAARREVIKRIVEFEEFSACWPADQLKAKGLIAEIRKVVNVKASFTASNRSAMQNDNRLRNVRGKNWRKLSLSEPKSALSVIVCSHCSPWTTNPTHEENYLGGSQRSIPCIRNPRQGGFSTERP